MTSPDRTEQIARIIAGDYYCFASARKSAEEKARAILALLPAPVAAEDVVERTAHALGSAMYRPPWRELKASSRAALHRIATSLNKAGLLRAPEAAPGWRPIETAPKDRKILLGKIVGHPDHPTALWWACSGSWSEKFKNWNDGVEPSGLSGPTHWSEFPSMEKEKRDA